MNLGAILGLVGGTACIIISIYSSGGTVMTYVDIASVFCTIGGSFFALMLQYGVKDVLWLLTTVFPRCFSTYDYSGMKLVEKMYELAEKARREGILSLEDAISDMPDEFMQKGLRLAVDGMDAEIIRNLLDTELSQMNGRHAKGMKMLDAWAKLAPGFGMLGTVLGLIAMMKNIEDKSRIGPNMAVALITTFYGAIMANFLFQPMMGKIQIDDGNETTLKEMVIEGVLSIQAGDNPRILVIKLASYLDPKEKKEVIDKYAKD
ncbi:MAG: motility protein A [Spirochaetes bacterium]|nr:motility protein A [Spirochaetota bacterium]